MGNDDKRDGVRVRRGRGAIHQHSIVREWGKIASPVCGYQLRVALGLSATESSAASIEGGA